MSVVWYCNMDRAFYRVLSEAEIDGYLSTIAERDWKSIAPRFLTDVRDVLGSLIFVSFNDIAIFELTRLVVVRWMLRLTTCRLGLAPESALNYDTTSGWFADRPIRSQSFLQTGQLAYWTGQSVDCKLPLFWHRYPQTDQSTNHPVCEFTDRELVCRRIVRHISLVRMCWFVVRALFDVLGICSFVHLSLKCAYNVKLKL